MITNPLKPNTLLIDTVNFKKRNSEISFIKRAIDGDINGVKWFQERQTKKSH